MRGEYSNRWRSDTKLQGSPPLARGVHFTEGLENEEKRITPACAGSTHKARRYEIRNKDHPRLRGEYFCAHPRVQVFSGSPPLARGVLLYFNSYGRGTGITPACAGSTILYLVPVQVVKDHPRLRGEYTGGKDDLADLEGSPPLARGVLRSKVSDLEAMGITPACAGSTP